MSRRGLERWRAFLVGSMLLLVLGSCRAIAGLHDVTYLASDGACPAPSLPTSGNGRVRLVNGGTQGGNVDFCIRASDKSDWGTPVLSGGSPACDTGLAYAQATVPFAVPVGSIDVEAIPAGSGCDATPTSELTGVTVGDNQTPDANDASPVVTLVRYGGGTNAENIVALPEEPAAVTAMSGPRSYSLRFVNALSSGESINAGFVMTNSVPPVITTLLPVPIPPGGVEPPALFPLLHSFDQYGYCAPPLTPLTFGVLLVDQLDAQLEGPQDPNFTFGTEGDEPDVQTLFAIGDSHDTSHPARGLLCDDPSDGSTLFAKCGLSNLPSLVVETFNTSLYGADAPFFDQRRSYVYEAIAARTSDLMCVIETALDVDEIVSHAQGNFPHSYFVTTDLDTTPTDPTNAQGVTPPPPSGPPCNGIDPSIVQSIYQCIAQNCTDTGDMTGHISTTSCLSEACVGPFAQIYEAGPQQNACFECIVYNATSEYPLSTGQQACTTDSRQPFSYDGMNGTLMLSRYPLTNTQAFILPGTGFRRVVLYAQVTLEDQTVDFFCGQFVSPLIDSELPYEGNYGDTSSTANGWEDEQDLQAQKTVPWILATAAHPAIIAGDWHATIQTSESDSDGGAGPDAGTMVVLDDQSPEVIKLLDQSYGGKFVRADPIGYKASCEFCPAPENVYNTGNVFPEDFTPTFLYGNNGKDFPANATVEEELWGQANTAVPLMSIPYEPAPTPPSGPLAEYYGRTVRILRPALPSSQ